MLFKRRHKEPILKRMRNWVWPKRGFSRAYNYWQHRVARLEGSSHSIAAGFACGAAVSFTPFLGFHIVFALGLAFLVRGSYVAAAIGTVVGNPWSFPIIFAATYATGMWMLNIDPTTAPPFLEWSMISNNFFETATTLLWPMLVGSVPYVVLVWFAVYFPMQSFLIKYKERKQKKREAKQARIMIDAKEHNQRQNHG